MNILYWTERFWPHIGGVEVLSLELIPALSKLNYDISVITSHSAAQLPDVDIVDDIEIQRFGFLTSLSNQDLTGIMRARQRLSNFKKQVKPDLVHIHFSGPSPLFHWQTQSAYNAPTLVTIHSLPPSFTRNGVTDNSLLINTLRNADWVNTVSAAKLNDIRQVLPELTEKSSLIYNGRSIPEVQAVEKFPDTPTMLCLGRLVDWKGFDLAIDAISSLIKNHPTLTLKIAGDGPELKSLTRKVKGLGLEENISFLGWVEPDKIPDLLNQVSAVLLPSREEETLPVVALQAAQMARPIIASNLAGFPEIIEHKQTGLLFEPNSSISLAKAISKIIEAPPEAFLMGQRAKEQAIERFNVDNWVAQYDHLYKYLIDNFRQQKSHKAG